MFAVYIDAVLHICWFLFLMRWISSVGICWLVVLYHIFAVICGVEIAMMQFSSN